jgi:hypothetical protein
MPKSFSKFDSKLYRGLNFENSVLKGDLGILLLDDE